MGKKKNTRKKVKKSADVTPPTTESAAPDAIELKLNELEVSYHKLCYDLLHLAAEKRLCTIQDEKTVLLEEGEKIKLIILNELAWLDDFIDHPYINNVFSGKLILLYVKFSILCGDFQADVKDVQSAFKSYYMAIEVLDKHHAKLNYKNDLLFQRIVKRIFEKFYTAFYTALSERINEKEAASIYLNVAKVYSAFKKNCGDGIVRASCLYEDVMKFLSAPEVDKKNKFLKERLKERREDFFGCVRNLQSQFEKMKTDNTFTTEYQLYNIELNYYRASIEDLAHPRAILSSNAVNGAYHFSLNEMPVYLTDDSSGNEYLNHWLSIKEKWVNPSMQLIFNINHDDIAVHPELPYHFKDALTGWFSANMMALDVFQYWANQLLFYYVELADTLSNSAMKKIADFILALVPETHFLLSNIEKLIKDAARYQHDFSETTFDINEMNEKIKKLEEKINPFKLKLEKQAEEKLKLVKANAKQLIAEEEKEKKEKLALLAQRLKRRYVSRCEKAINYDEPEENIAPENRLDLEAVTLISAELMDLQQVDIAVLQLADNLKIRSSALLDFLQPFSKLNTPLTSNLRRELLEKMNLMLLEYHQLITLHEKYKLLIGTQEIQRDASIQEGIGMGCSELKKLSEEISQNIQAILSSFDEIIKLQKKSRENKIRQLGQQKAAECGLTHLTDKEIMEMGRQIYISIGETKIANKQKLSEFTLQKDFLDDMQLNFASFDYLQQKMKPYINENHNEALLAMNFFARPKSNGAYSAWSLASIEGLLGLTLRCQYDKCGDVAYLHQASLHFRKAHNIFEAEKNVDSMNEVAAYLAGIEEILASTNLQEQCARYG
jgi:hypothetical protein